MGKHRGIVAVAMLDILGFKALMQEMDPEVLYDATLGQLPIIIERSTMALWTEAPLHSAAFSDTLFLWLEPNVIGEGKLDGFAAIQDMCLVVSGLLARGMRRHIALRGAIAYGECFIADEPPAFLGKPIIDAYELEQRQQWAGAALCPSAAEQLGDLSNMAPDPHRPVVRYAVPMKRNAPEELLAIRWPNAFDLPHPREAMRVREDAPEPLRNEAREKIENTINFYERFKSHFQPYIDEEGCLVIAEVVVPDRER